MRRREAHEDAHTGSQEGVWVLAVLALLAGPLAIGIALVLRSWLRTRPRRLAWTALAGAVLTLALSPVVIAHGSSAWVAVATPVSGPGTGLGAALGHVAWCWLALAGTGPALVWVWVWSVPPTVRELELRAQRRQDRRSLQPTPRIRGRHAEHVDGVVLGERLAGDAVLPSRGRELVLPLEVLARHALVVGASGSGKTETLLRIAHEVAHRSDWRVFFVDGKGDRDTMRRFYALMHDAGRKPRLFPDEGYDGWRGSPADIAARLVEVIDFAEDGPGAYYRDQAVNLIRLACQAPTGPPRSAAELLYRLDIVSLETAYLNHPAQSEVSAYTPRQVAEVRARYSAFFGAIRERLDHGWAFEDADAGYLLLDGLRLKHEATRLARLLVEDFTQYAVDRKPRTQRVLLIVDEFSAIAAAGTSLVDIVERTRGFGVAAILSPQVIEGMGGPEVAARIIGSAHTVLVHQIPQPEEIIKVAGTRMVMETSVQHDQGRATGLGSARLQHAYRVDPNQVRALPVGVCFAIRAGQAATVRITRAPELADAELPIPSPPSAATAAPETPSIPPLIP